jgi:hypothetical protein
MQYIIQSCRKEKTVYINQTAIMSHQLYNWKPISCKLCKAPGPCLAVLLTVLCSETGIFNSTKTPKACKMIHQKLQVHSQHCPPNCRGYLAKLTVLYTTFLVQQVYWHYYCCFALLLFIDQQIKHGNGARLQVIFGKSVGYVIYEKPAFR